ncbi:MAG: hypothetical protein JWM27_2667, partial [Gemmatimonadetes bacterium]|nr:hypothetical protein [Gemmatimonadota bacterium]
ASAATASASALALSAPAAGPQTLGLGVEDVATLPIARDPAAEGLGGEQVGRARTGIEIVIKRP